MVNSSVTKHYNYKITLGVLVNHGMQYSVLDEAHLIFKACFYVQLQHNTVVVAIQLGLCHG